MQRERVLTLVIDYDEGGRRCRQGGQTRTATDDSDDGMADR